MIRIYLNEGPRDGDVEHIEDGNTEVRLGVVWAFRRPGPSSPVMVDYYRINQGPDDGGHYAAQYKGTDEY